MRAQHQFLVIPVLLLAASGSALPTGPKETSPTDEVIGDRKQEP